MSAQKSPLRDRLLSNSPDPIKSSIIRDSGMGWISPNSNTGSNSSGSSGSITSPLRIAKRDSPRSLPHPPVARRTSASFRHVRTNNLVSKSPFKSQIPTPSATPVRQVSFPSPRRVSGEKRPRPSSIHYQAEDENERPFALKRERKQSKTFQGLIQKEPVTKSPFKLPTLDTEEVTSPPPPLLHLIPSAPSSSLPLAALSATPTSSSGVSPGRSSLVSRRMHGPRLSNGVQNRRQRRKTVTWDENCDVVEISADEHETDGEDNAENHMGVDDEEGDDDPFFRGNQPSQAARTSEEYSHDSNDVSTEHLSLELDPDASISGLVEEMFASSTGKALDSSSPLPDRDEHTFTDVVTSTPPRQVDGHHVPFDLDTEDGIPLGRSHHAARFLQHQRECYSSPKPSPPPFSYVSAHSSPQQLINGQAFNLPTQPSPYGPPATPPRRRTTASPNLSVAHSPNAVVDTTATSSAVRTPEVDSDIGPSHLATPPIGRSTHAERQQLAQEESCPDVAMLPGSPSPSKPMKNHNNPQLHNNEGLIPQFRIDVASSDRVSTSSQDHISLECSTLAHQVIQVEEVINDSVANYSLTEDDFIANSSQDISQASSDEEDLGEPEPSFAVDRHSEHHSPTRPPHDDSSSEVLEGNEFFEQPSEMFDQEIDSSSDGNRFLMPVSTTQPKDDMVTEKDTTSLLTAMTDISTETAVVECAERKTLTGHNVAQHEDDPIEGGGQLHFDFGSELHYDLNGKDQTRAPLDNTREEETLSLQSGSSVKVGELDVDMDMRSALDRLMDDVAGPHLADSIVTEEGNSYEMLLPRRSDPRTRTMERAHTDSELLHNNFLSRNMSVSSGSSIPPPPPPPKDNIRNREQMILERRREARLVEHEEFASPKAHEDQKLLGVGRPTRRRSMSTGDADLVGRDSKNMRDILLDVVGVDETEVQDEQFRHSIEQELKKMAAAPAKSKMKYHVREREGTIYASSSDPDMVSHLARRGDVNPGKAWRPVRRPSDMNEYSKQIKEYRAQEKSEKAHGKVFVKVLGVKGIHVPLPEQPTFVTCTLNNGIHFVSTPECQLSRDFAIEQEFELIEHNKLEFTLTVKVRRDAHIITQFKDLSPPPFRAPAAPPPVVQSSSKSGMRSFFSSSPKKSLKDKIPVQNLPVPPQPAHKLPENLARYLKQDGTMARAFISFKDIAARCDTRLFETNYPLIGQRAEAGGKFSTLQIGEIVLQIFRLPPLPGIAPEQLPQSLEECHRGLRHINWHKVTYFEGILTQSGGDCSTWRRRQLRVIGANIVAFNDVTKRATVTIDLKKAIAVEDNQDIRKNALSPGGSSRYDEDDSLFGVERSFRLIFPHGEDISFFADTDDEKTRWLDVLRALIGHIPPHPFWAEVLWQRQEELTRVSQPPSRPPQSPPTWLISRGSQR